MLCKHKHTHTHTWRRVNKERCSLSQEPVGQRELGCYWVFNEAERELVLARVKHASTPHSAEGRILASQYSN